MATDRPLGVRCVRVYFTSLLSSSLHCGPKTRADPQVVALHSPGCRAPLPGCCAPLHFFSHHITLSSYHHIVISSYHHIVIPSYHHIIISSYHHIIVSSYHHIIISSYHHVIMSSCHRIIISSYHNMIISSYHSSQRCPKKCTRHFSKNLSKRPGEISIRKGFRINPGTIG